MDANKYLDHLKAELKGFPDQEKAALIAEVAAHIDEGQTDPRLGQALPERSQKLDSEMGSPHDLGRRFKEIYRPNRWVDFLLVFVPYEILKYPILILLSLELANMVRTNSSTFSEPYLIASSRIFFLLYCLLVLISLRRRSLAVLFFWLPQAILTAYTLIFREKRWLPQSPFNSHMAGIVESLLWLILLASLVSWLVYLLWSNRHNVLLVVLALIPFLITVGNMTISQYISIGYFPDGYQLPRWNMAVIGGFPMGLYQISMVIWPLLFYVSGHRQIRWLGLLFYAVPIALMNFVALIPYPHLASVWIIPAALVIVGWLIDQLTYTHQPKLIS